MTKFTVIPASLTALPQEPYKGRHFINGQWQDTKGQGELFEMLSSCASEQAQKPLVFAACFSF